MSPTATDARHHAMMARRLFPVEARYRQGLALGLAQQAMANPSDHDLVRQAVAVLQEAVKIDAGDARLVGHLIAFRLELGLPVDGMMDRFIGIARAGPSVKVSPAPSLTDGKEPNR